MFDELCKTPCRPRKRKERHAVEVEDGTLLGFAAFKDLQVLMVLCMHLRDTLLRCVCICGCPQPTDIFH